MNNSKENQKVMIIGATSAIAQEVGKCYAEQGSQMFLVARDTQKLESVKNDLLVRGAQKIETHVTDVNDFKAHPSIVSSALESLSGLDVALIAHGTLGNQKACENDFLTAQKELDTNFMSTVSFLTLLANGLAEQGHGTIAVISSVAGDRGRQSNYVYGTAKGALNTFLQGMRNRLNPSGVHVLTIKPGFVDTPMTADFPKGFLFASPKKVGRGIYKAIRKKKDVVYLPGFWRVIMTIIRMIPERIFKRMKL